jgi:hypothetical protein
VKYTLTVSIAVLLILSLSTIINAEIPLLINYQGSLHDDTGAPVADAYYPLYFKIYNSNSGVDSLWSSGEVSVLVLNGLFNVQLGASPMTSLPDDLFTGGANRYLGIRVGPEPELAPRSAITSSPYAFHALRADTADYAINTSGGAGGWVDDGLTVRLSNSNDSVGIGTSNPQAKLHIQTPAATIKLGQASIAVYGEHPMSTSYGYLGATNVGAYGYSDDWYGVQGGTHNGTAVFGGTSDNYGIGVKGHNSNGNYGYLGGKDYAVYGNASSGFAGYFNGKMYIQDKLGIGVVTPGNNKLDVEGSAVIGSSFSGSATAPTNGLLVQGDVGIGISNPNRRLYVADAEAGTAFPLKVDNYHSQWNNCAGILFSVGGDGGNQLAPNRGKGALVYEYAATWNRGIFHFLQSTSTDSLNPDLSESVMSILNNGRVGVGTTNPTDLFEVKGNNHYMVTNTTGAETGLRIKQNGTSKWSLAWNSGSGYLYFYDHTSKEGEPKGGTRMVIEDGTGNVGIGTASPTAKLEVNGDLKVSGTVHGQVTYPAPNYDSGWLAMMPGMIATFTHNVGGDINRYVVDLEFKSTDHGWGIHNYGIGHWEGTSGSFVGVHWHNLTATTIKVKRAADDWLANEVRIRIWMYE